MRALAVAAAVLALCGCHRQGPDAAVREAVSEMVDAIERGDIGGFTRYVAAGYSDSDSNDAASLRGQLFVWLRRSGSIRVTYRVDSVTVPSPDAVQSVVIAGVSDGPILSPDTRGEVLWISCRWAREDGRWKVHRADFDEATAVELLGI